MAACGCNVLSVCTSDCRGAREDAFSPCEGNTYRSTSMRNSLASSKCCDAPFDMVDDEEQSSTLYLGNLPKDPRICRRLLYEIGVQVLMHGNPCAAI